MPHNTNTSLKTTAQILNLFWWFIFLMQGQSHAQVNNRDVPLRIYLPAQKNFCPNAPVEIAPDSITGGTAPFQYRWILNNEIVSVDSVVQLALSDTSFVELRIIDSNGKIVETGTWLYPYVSLDASFSVDVFQGCSPLEVLFESNFVAFQNCQSMVWNLGTENTIQQMASCSFEYRQDGIYTPSLQITDLHGCVWSDTLEIPIRVFPNPEASYSIESTRIYLPKNKLNVVNTSSGGDSFTWLLSGSQPVFEFEPTIEVPSEIEGTYELELIAENAFGCRSTASKSIEVVQAIELYIPNCFTPNGDGINDTWIIQGPGMDAQHMSIEVYDSWGTLVFISSNPEEAWTGLSADLVTPLNSGNYNYRLIARDTERGVGHLIEGHVLLLR
jgi:gliding motility-associated-like protein